MLEDRSYMRRPRFYSYRSATLLLVIMNVVAYILQLSISSFSTFPVNHYFALSPAGLQHAYLWQLITFQFMHAGWVHLFFNCFAIYMFGREVEEVLGRRSFFVLYFTSGILGGLVQALAGFLVGGQFAVPVVGASAGAFGLTAAFAVLYPEQVLYLFALIPLRAKYLLALSVIAALWGLLFVGKNTSGIRVADAAHLGGMITGVIYIRYAIRWNWPSLRRASKQPTRRLVKVHSQKSGAWAQTKPDIEDLPPEEFLSREVDPILDKISAKGFQSLTARERQMLEAARKKLGR